MWKLFNFKTGEVIRNIQSIDDNIILDARGDDSATVTIPLSSLSSGNLKDIARDFRPHRGLAWVEYDGFDAFVPFAGYITKYRFNTENETVTVNVSSVKDYYDRLYVIPHNVDEITSTNSKWTIDDVSPKGYLETLINDANERSGTPNLPPAGGGGLTGSYKKVHNYNEFMTIKEAIDACADEREGIEMRWNYGYDDINDYITFTPRYPASGQRLVGITTRRSLNFNNPNVLVTSMDTDRDHDGWYNILWNEILVDGGEDGDTIDIERESAPEWDNLPRSETYQNFNSALTGAEREAAVTAMLKASYKPSDNWEINIWVQDSLDNPLGGLAQQYGKKMTWGSNSTSWLGNKVQLKNLPDEFNALMGVQRVQAIQFSTHSPIVTLQLTDLREVYPAYPKRALPKDKKKRGGGDDGGWNIDEPIIDWEDDPDWNNQEDDGSSPINNPIYALEFSLGNDHVTRSDIFKDDTETDNPNFPRGVTGSGSTSWIMKHLVSKTGDLYSISFVDDQNRRVGVEKFPTMQTLIRGSGSSLRPTSDFNDPSNTVVSYNGSMNFDNFFLRVASGKLNAITGEVDDYETRATLKLTKEIIWDWFYKVPPEGQPMDSPWGRYVDTNLPKVTHEKEDNFGASTTGMRHRWMWRFSHNHTFVTDNAIYIGFKGWVELGTLSGNTWTRLNEAPEDARVIIRWIIVTNVAGSYDAINDNSFMISPQFIKAFHEDQTGVWGRTNLNGGFSTGNYLVITNSIATEQDSNNWSDQTFQRYAPAPWAVVNGFTMPPSMNVERIGDSFYWEDSMPVFYDDDPVDPKKVRFNYRNATGSSVSVGSTNPASPPWHVGWSPVTKGRKALWGFVRGNQGDVYVGDNTTPIPDTNRRAAVATLDLQEGAPKPGYITHWVTKKLSDKKPYWCQFNSSIFLQPGSSTGSNLHSNGGYNNSSEILNIYGIPIEIYDSGRFVMSCLSRQFTSDDSNGYPYGIRYYTYDNPDSSGVNQMHQLCYAYSLRYGTSGPNEDWLWGNGYDRTIQNLSDSSLSRLEKQMQYIFYGGRLWKFFSYGTPNTSTVNRIKESGVVSIPITPVYTPPETGDPVLDEIYSIPMNPWVLL